ncbi:MAG: hypothetical protein BGO55_08700 [Sphingobacteriales bacterium 50-39]|nr:MAG: hypothetical protein BGO55_08700 [Sphingobacteriales bacterium 50-39]
MGPWIVAFLILFFCSCNKLVEIPQPNNTITIEKLFENDPNANAAIASIYSQMNSGSTFYNLRYANGLTTIAGGASSDELNIAGFLYSQFQKYSFLSTDGQIGMSFWTPAYNQIYQANAAIESLSASKGVSPALKTTLRGEAKFLRAFAHFYLVNLFGDIPIVTQSEWSKINLLKRSPVDSVYSQIIQDLTDAQAALPSDYSAGGGEKIRANKWAATALLARVYLYKGDWANAEQQASLMINSGLFRLPGDPDSVFLKNSDEAILQWQTQDAATNKYATVEGTNLIPTSHTSSAAYSLTAGLLGVFEPNDLRRSDWVDSTKFGGKYYFFPFKYKVKVGTAGGVTEYYMVLRYAEQYLIRAEARAKTGTDLAGAQDDINMIRRRAGLNDLDPSLDQAGTLAAIAQERRVEFFAEWGHRWFDLKRRGEADAVLGSRAGWRPEVKLWPIPATELITDPNLVQNPGYN